MKIQNLTPARGRCYPRRKLPRFSKVNIFGAMERLLKFFLVVIVFGATSADAANFTVKMTGFQFSPKDLTVNVGDTVTWVNQDPTFHDTTSGVGRVPSGVWKSPLLGNGGSFSFTFNVAPGTYPYYCTPHVFTFNMVGSVTVLPPNTPPSVSITSPQNGAKFTTGANILIEAVASDNKGVARVEFFVDGNLIATDFSAPYSASLTNVAVGNYFLTATAFDAEGLSATSTTVEISVADSPTIVMTQPNEGARFGLGTNIFVAAEVTAAGLTAANVQFFESDGTNFQAISPPLTTAPYNFLWNPENAGTHRLRAIVTDEAGGTTPSAAVTVEVFEQGTKNPTIAVTDSPPNFSRATNSTLFISGIAGDDVRLDYVEFQVNGGAFVRAAGLSNWTAQVELIAGTNVIHFRSVDFAGNISTNDTRIFTYVLNSPTVIVRGFGKVTPNLDGKLLTLGRTYQMVARPGRGQIFGGWNGTAVSNIAVLNFEMKSNLVLTANFVPNSFAALKGTYTGLFFETNNVRATNSGFIKIQVSSRGKFSGKLTLDGRNLPLRGALDYSGNAEIPLLRRPISPVLVTLNLDLSGANGISGEVTDGNWVSVLVAKKALERAVIAPRLRTGNRSITFDVIGEPLSPDAAIEVRKLRSSGAVSFRFTDSTTKKNSPTAFWAADNSAPFFFLFDRSRPPVLGNAHLNLEPAQTK
jgi:plastocyanin